MRRFLTLIILFLSFCFMTSAKNPKLKYTNDGTFKIAQFTDLHLTDVVADTVFTTIKNVVSIEKPDLVVLTGDVTCAESNLDLIRHLGFIFHKQEQPWVMIFGNHDDELGVSLKDLAKLYQSFPFNLNSHTKGVDGESNFTLEISDAQNTIQNVLYFFDSHAYNKIKDRVEGSYAWIDVSQINWYRDMSKKFTKGNKEVPVPSLAFFHIPLPEYKMVWEKDSVYCVGQKNEEVCSPEMNSGLFTAMLEGNDILGTFTGHDHVNDFIGSFNGIALAYGRFSGASSTYGNLTPGARIIVLKKGQRSFDTWIRTTDGNVTSRCTYKDGEIVNE